MDRTVLNSALASFSFVIDECELVGPLIVDENFKTKVRYSSISLGVEIELDWRERDVFVLFVRLTESDWPDGYYVDRSGRKCRVHLIDAVRRLALSSGVQVTSGRAKPSDERMLTELTRQASLLKGVLSEILANRDVTSIFE